MGMLAASSVPPPSGVPIACALIAPPPPPVLLLLLQMKELVLVEVDGGLVKHERIIKAVAASIRNDITLTVLPVHRQ